MPNKSYINTAAVIVIVCKVHSPGSIVVVTTMSLLNTYITMLNIKCVRVSANICKDVHKYIKTCMYVIRIYRNIYMYIWK